MARKNKDTRTFNHPDLKNSFSTLYANIRFASVDNTHQSIAITSVGMDEGKSTIAANLALSIVQAGQSCVIVDADLRKHTLSQMLNIQTDKGLYSILSGTSSIFDAVCPTQFDNLYFIDCEPNLQNPADIIGSDRFAALMTYLKNNFDYIILDTPPLISFVDGSLVSSIADGTVLVIREGKTKKADIKNAVTQLQQANAKILGTVLTFSSDTTESDYYYAYYNKKGKRVRKRDKNLVPNNTVDANEINKNLNDWMYQNPVPPNQNYQNYNKDNN